MYENKSLNVVIPMAGAGSRFAQVGHILPKPLIEFQGKTMIEHVVANLKIDAQYTFIVQQEHIDKFDVDQVLKRIDPSCNIVALNGITDGAACSVLHTKHIIDNDDALFIVNSDNMIEWDTANIMIDFESKDGGIILIEASGPKWSYAALDNCGYATNLAEKIQISEHATTGHYYWASGADFVRFTEQMIAKDIRFNNEFYIAPVYNFAIAAGRRIFTRHANKFWSVGTPEDLEYFLAHSDKTKL